MRSLLLLLAAPLLAACSSATPLSIIITTGEETNAFQACNATAFDIDVDSLDGTIMLSQKGLAVGASFDFGDVDASQQVTVTVTGFDPSGATVMQGTSLTGILLESVQGGVPVFVECVNQWSRPPCGLEQSHVNGVAFVEVERYLALTGGTAPKGAPSTNTSAIDSYDLATLGGASTAAYDIVPQTAVSIGEQVLLIDSASATWVDFSEEAQTDNVTPPAATSWSSWGDVAGGQVIPAPANSSGVSRYFVVGGTRTVGMPTPAVVEVDGDETLTGYQLSVPRAGAAAAWVDNVGLVVAGGSTETPGVEVLLDGQTSFSPQQGYAAIPTVGAGGVFDGSGGMLLFGGLLGGAPAPAGRINPPVCGSGDCMPGSAPPLPVGLTNVSAYAVGGGNSIVFGSEIAQPGLDRTFYVGTSGVVELPLREPRSGATPLPTPLGTLAVLGGQHADGSPATCVEMLWPTTTMP